ncbi:LPS export ABC transporter permease LptG [Rhodovibrio salinarum]|uniref:LPS export ABC transporter permease LptG n=1 Tax=Rhodovibrio salinarum TaxID=1087 RepID=A0A934QIK5_9PROT|nr:LPS export ABC transporter permease LptG [Rhodovibrio salinarum]MBK1697449.1 LPS export ABC transporter permease LptG [Rhodovibrio salinarum]
MTLAETQRRVLPRIGRVNLAPTLLFYVGRTFLARFLVLFAGICAIVLLITTVDQLDQLASAKGTSVLTAFLMALLKLPQLAQEIMAFAVLFTGMATLWRLTRTNELVVARAAGVSVWQMLAPVVLISVLIGVVTTTVLNPVSSVMLRRFEQLQARYTGDTGSTLSVSETGLWLRQANENGRAVIHARRVRQSDMTLFDVIVFRFDNASTFTGRIDATRAQLDDGRWVLSEALVTEPGGEGARREARVSVPTELTADKIYQSFAPPETISFWRLPEFVQLLENAGFAADAHRLQFHRLLAKPLLFAGMVLLAAVFSLRQHRRGGVAVTITLGVLTGFAVFVLSNLVFAFGLSATLPVPIAAWTPSLIIVMLGAASLLHLEDG